MIDAIHPPDAAEGIVVKAHRLILPLFLMGEFGDPKILLEQPPVLEYILVEPNHPVKHNDPALDHVSAVLVAQRAVDRVGMPAIGANAQQRFRLGVGADEFEGQLRRLKALSADGGARMTLIDLLRRLPELDVLQPEMLRACEKFVAGENA